MRIQHNIMAMNAYRNYNNNTSALSKNLEKLSSGYKINRAGDDAAGLAISEKMRAQITGLEAAQKNVKDGISLVKTGEGAMQEIQDMLNRMDYLATQSANGTYDNEVDRANLQKEVESLKSEINRIADSANFNGIKLLDGKAGVNTTAFTKFENVAGVKGHNGSVDLKDLFAADNASNTPQIHKEGEGSTKAQAEAVIDLGDLKLEGVSNTDSPTVQIKLAGQTFTATMTGSSTYDATAIASKLLDAIKATSGASNQIGGAKTTDGTGATGSDATGIRIGNAVYTASASNGTIKLQLAGTFDANGANYKAYADGLEADRATAVNQSLGFSVEKGTASKGKLTGEVVHQTTQVVQAKGDVDAPKAGIDLTLNSQVVAQGNILEIDGYKIQFELNDTSVTSADGADAVINLADLKGKPANDIIHAAVDKLSKLAKFNGDDGREWKIGSAGNNKIHIEQVKATDAGKDKLDTYEKITDKIKVTGDPTTDKGKGVAITVDSSKVAAGNTMTFTLGKDSVTLKVVESGADNTKGEINKADITDASKLEAALNSEVAGKYTVEVANGTGDDADKKVVTVRSKLTTNANQAAVDASLTPIVTGNGLMLQIGDTSDSYNRLAVKIGDMHTTALGIDGIDIGNAEGASAAIQTIRDAINQVSGVRGDLGAIQNRLEHTQNNLSVMAENIQDAESTIRDTDVAEEMMSYVKNNILVQSAQAMLAQANQVPQGVLQLLG